MRTAAFRVLAALLLLALVGLALFRAVPIRAEMTDLLPPGRTPAAEFLLRELRSGAATTLLLAGIEGAPEPELARISRAVGDALRQSGRFSFVGNGAFDLSEAERDLIFAHRYLLAPAAFDAATLRAKLGALLEGLRSSASPLLAQFGFADPPGAFFDLLRGWLGQSRVRMAAGAWFADDAEHPRALIVARSNASGLDTAAQAAAVEAFRAAFASSAPGGARLLLSGPGVFGAEAAAAIRADVEMISLLSGLLILGFLWLRYRSVLMLFAVAVPLAAGTLAGMAAVGLVFGAVHGAALGFGMCMLGVVVDYPLLLVTQRGEGEALAATARRIRPTLLLAAAAAALGLTGMVASGFPILQQLGLFGAAGLLVGVAVTLWVLPRLLPGAAIRPRPLPAPFSRGLEWLRGRRAIALAVPLAGVVLLALSGPHWEDDLARLSPVPAAQLRLDEELRAQLGAPDVRGLIAITAPDADAVLQKAEAVQRALAPLVSAGTLAGFDSPARFLPPAATQRARQAALPDDATLRANLTVAAEGLPFRPAAFDRFLLAVAASRALPPLTVADLPRLPTLAARLGPLLSSGPDGWRGLVIPQGLKDDAALRLALDGLRDPAILWVDVKAETTGVVTEATRQALLWCAVGGLGVLVLLAFGLRRGPGAALWTAAPIAGALVVVVAVLTLLQLRLTPFHLAALLLAAGVGMDYALFLGTGARQHAREARQTLAAVFNCTMTTLLTFGLLAFCATPVMRGIGLTVAIGVVAAFLLALSLAPRPRAGDTVAAAPDTPT